MVLSPEGHLTRACGSWAMSSADLTPKPSLSEMSTSCVEERTTETIPSASTADHSTTPPVVGEHRRGRSTTNLRRVARDIYRVVVGDVVVVGLTCLLWLLPPLVVGVSGCVASLVTSLYIYALELKDPEERRNLALKSATRSFLSTRSALTLVSGICCLEYSLELDLVNCYVRAVILSGIYYLNAVAFSDYELLCWMSRVRAAGTRSDPPAKFDVGNPLMLATIVVTSLAHAQYPLFGLLPTLSAIQDVYTESHWASGLRSMFHVVGRSKID